MLFKIFFIHLHRQKARSLAQLVARHLAKVEVAGSIPVARSIGAYGRFRPAFFISQGEMAKW